jgi:hypothetical protein
MGESWNRIAASSGENECFGSCEAHHVSISPEEDRRRRTPTLGEIQSGKEEGSLTYGARLKPATSVAGFLFDEESLRLDTR